MIFLKYVQKIHVTLKPDMNKRPLYTKTYILS